MFMFKKIHVTLILKIRGRRPAEDGAFALFFHARFKKYNLIFWIEGKFIHYAYNRMKILKIIRVLSNNVLTF